MKYLVALRSAVYIFSVITIFFIGDIFQRLALWIFGRNFQQKVVEKVLDFYHYMGIYVLGTRIVITGDMGNIDDRPVLVVSNHQSLTDIPIFWKVFRGRHIRFISKIELGKFLPLVSFNLRNGGSALIDRKNATQAISEIEKFASGVMQEGGVGVIFPEGTRAKDGVMKRFKRSGLDTLFKKMKGARLILVCYDNSYKVTSQIFPMGCDITIKMHLMDAGIIDEQTSISEIEDRISRQLVKFRETV